MPPERREMVNDIHLVTGGYFPGAAAEEVIVNQRFAEANELRIGDTFQATINERKETLRIVGTAISPEYVYALRNVQQFAPDDAGFAVVFARESFVEDAFDMTNAFNQVTGLLRPGANADRVLDRIEQELEPYGVYVKYSRKDQVSNRYLTEELKGVKSSAQVVPMVFLVVAAVVVHIIVHRLTEMQRTQIGLLCAMGYSKPRVVSHYVSYALIIAVVGTAAGSLGGYHMAGGFMRMYNRFFRFPSLRVVFQPSAVVLAFALSGGMCMLGAARSAWNVLKMEPAQAIRPATGATERTVRPGRLSFLWKWLPLNWRMTVRSAVRSRARSLFSVFGVAVATMMLVVGATTMDYFDWLIAYQFGQVDRSDVRVDFANERPEAAVLEIEKVEGVRRAEGILQVGGQLRNGWRTKYVV
ncbi:MAG: FtsX-like permease family protein, partial [Xanthomonadales bacterium]|nr:FtsX-like permease family protein [Xanthomonadales bacterium]NIO15383.1 FtsX-like permease family protein [Xanthomonadales bacterium]